MNRVSGIKWLYNELPNLINRGIFSEEIAKKLRQYYGEVKSVSRTTTMLIILGTVGALLIGLGIILLFAHNWENFSRLTRTILSLLPLVIGQYLCLWVLRNRPESGAFKEATGTFLSLMVGASISLISQTYNLPADASAFILTWMFLIIPITYFMQASIPAAIYLVGITIWSSMQWNDPGRAFMFWPLLLIAIPHFIWTLGREVYALRTALLALIISICITIAAGQSLGKIIPGSWIIVYTSIFSIFYSLGHLKIKEFSASWQPIFRFVGAVGSFILALMATYSFVWHSYRYSEYSSMFKSKLPLPVVFGETIVSICLITLALLLFYDNLKRKNTSVALFSVIPLLAIIGFITNEGSAVLPIIIFNLYLFVSSISRIREGIRRPNLAVVNSGMLMLAVLIIARFFDSDINFILKGLVFICVGIGFLAVNLRLARRLGGAND